MGFVSVIEPPDPIVTWTEAKAHLRLDSDDEQTFVEGLIAAATAWIDGPAGWLGRALGEQTIEEKLDAFCSSIILSISPVLEITEVAYIDEDGDEQEVEDTVYGVLGREVFLRTDQSWPSPISGEPGAAIIRYTAGYEEVPAAIKHAILLMVGNWFANREAVITGTISSELPLAVEALLQPYRIWT